jgi:mannose-1-phosphate guanylyltransferase
MPPLRDAGPPHDLWVVVLAGGEGRRLQGFVRKVLGADRPKQFCRIIGRRSMLRHTWDRAMRLVDPARIVTVATAGQERFLEEEDARGGLPGRILVQPENRETAAGLVLPLLWISQRAPDAIVAVLPADHFVWEEARFAAYIETAAAASREWLDRLVLLGVEAAGPEPDYGWIAPGVPLRGGPGSELYLVRRFWEKPDPKTAIRLFACGYFWNTLVVVGRLEAYLGLADDSLPDVAAPLRVACAAREVWTAPGVLQAAYRRIPATNFSRGLLARHPERLALLAARGVYWSDWGDADRIVETLRRFERRPTWLPEYVVARSEAASGSRPMCS